MPTLHLHSVVPPLPPTGDEEEVVVMGGEGFTPEQIAEAEADFERRLGISLTGGCGWVCVWWGACGGEEQQQL